MRIEAIIDAGIIAGSVILMLFCIVLARRLRRLNNLEEGLGGAIAVMSAEVDRLEKSILAARAEALAASENLAAQVAKAKSEQARWDLHLKMRHAVPLEPTPERAAPARLRKRRVPVDA